MAGMLLLGGNYIQGKSVLNADYNGADMYLNVAKSFGSFTINGNSLANFNADQYPTGTLTNAYGGNVSLPKSYYGRYVIKWTGTAAFNLLPTSPTIFYSGGGGVFNITPSATGNYLGGPTCYNTGNATQPTDMNIELAFGALLTGVGTNGGLVQFTVATNIAFNIPTGTRMKFSANVVGLPTGPNSDGSWTLNHDDNQHFSLQGSSAYAGLVSITAAGGAGVQSEGLIDVGGQATVNFPSTVPGQPAPVYAFSNFIFCKKADLSDIAAGRQISQPVIDSIRNLKPKYLRFMDMMTVQAGYPNYSQRATANTLIYSGIRYDPTTYGTVGGTGDTYTVSNPSGSPASGAYVDGEVVQFVADRANTTRSPTLAITGRTSGAKRIYANTVGQLLTPLLLPLSGTPTAGDVISVVFTASYLPSGAYTFTYTVQASDTTLSAIAGHMVTNLQADAVLAANGFLFGNSGGLSVYYIPTLGMLTVTSSTSGAATETLTPQQVAIGAIANATVQTFTYSIILDGWMFSTSNISALWCGAPLEVMYELCTRSNVGAWFCLPLIYTSSSAQSLGTAAAVNLPGLPVVVEYSNEIWNTFAAPANQAIVFAVALGFTAATGNDTRLGMYMFYGLRVAQLLQTFATAYVNAGGARSNLSCSIQNWGIESTPASPTNGQMQPYKWNGQGLTPSFTATATISGTALTITGIQTGGAIFPGYLITGAGVTAGTKIYGGGTAHGNGSYLVNNSQTVGPVTVTISNPVYSTVGGFDGTATSTSYNAFPTRPIDIADSVGYAVYYSGALANQGSATWSGTQSFYNTLFQASADYATGIPASMTSALNAWSNDVRSGTKNSVAGADTIAVALAAVPSGNSGYIKAFDNFAAGYDGARPSGKGNLSVVQYEGSLQQTLAANSFNGTTTSLSPSDLNAQFTTNGWTLNPTYGASNLAVATNIVTLFLAYVNSSQYYDDQLFLWQQSAIIHAARPSFAPAQFGVSGPATTAVPNAAPLWGLYPGDITTTPLANYNAEAFYNNS